MGKGQQKVAPTRSAKGSSGSGGAPKRVRDNSAMQDKLAQDAPPTMDEGGAGLLADFTTFKADYAAVFGKASSLTRQAHDAQDGGDIPRYRASVDALLDEKQSLLWTLDWFLPGHGITEQLAFHVQEHPEQLQIPAYKQGLLDVIEFSRLVKSQRALIVPFLVPRTVHGKAIPAIPPMDLGDLTYTEGVVGQVGALEPILDGATEIRALLAAGGSARGAAANSLATEIVSGAMSDYEPGSGEFEYLYTVVTASNASAEVKARVDWLLGRDDFSAYEGFYGIAAYSGALLDFALNATTVAPAAVEPKEEAWKPPTDAAVDPKSADALAAGRAAGKTPGVRDFDSSKLPKAEEKKETEEEKAAREREEGTVKGYAGNRGRERVETSYEREGKLTAGDGKVGAEAAGKRKVERRDGSKNQVGAEGSIEAGETLSGTGKISGSRTSTNGNTVGGAVSAGRDAEGNFTGSARVEGGHADPKGNGTTYGKTVGYDNKNGATIGTDVTTKKKNADDSTTSTTGGATIGTNGTVAINAGRTNEAANGDKRSTTGSAGYDHQSGEINGSFKRSNTDKDGEDKGSFGGGASVDLSGKDGKTGVKADFSASKGGKSVTLKGGYSVTVNKPVLVDGRWVITWETDLSGAVGGGAKGKKGGASGSIGGGKKKTGRKSFASKKEAEAFFADPKLDGMPGVDDVASMAEGDTRGTESNFNMGGDAIGSIGAVEIGAGGSHSSAEYQTVTKGKGGKVRVEVGKKVLDEVHGSIGMAGVSGGVGKSWASHKSLTVEFDLATPEGKNAYDHYQRFGALPRGARGWRVVGTAQGNAETDSYTLGLLGVKVGTSHTVSSGVEHNEGNKLERDAGTDAVSVSVPLLGSYARSHQLSMLQVNDGRQFFNTESTVKASDMDDVRKGLAKSAQETEQGRGGSNKGTYRLQSAISEADIDRFIQVALAPDARHQFLRNGGNHAADGLSDLASGLRKAGGDRDAQRRILARWVADEGYDALTVLHTLTHGKFDADGKGGTSMYVAIDGDPYMTGMKGQLDLELRIQGWDQRLKNGERGPTLASEVRKDITFQREKARHLESCGELPYRIYAQEFDRVRGNVAVLEAVLQRALVNDGAPSAGAAALESPKFAAFRRATANLSVARAECERLWGWTYKQYQINEKGAFQAHGTRRAKFLPTERENFDRARNLWARAENARGGAILAESLSNQALDERTVAPLTALVTKARSEYLRAKGFYQEVDKIYEGISLRTIGQGPYVHNYGERVTPGQ